MAKSKASAKAEKLSFRYEGKVYSVYGYTPEERISKKALKIDQLRRGELVVESGMTVEAWAEQFLKVYKTSSMKDYVFKNYEWSLKHYVLDIIGH